MKKVDVVILTALIFNLVILGYFFIFEFKKPATECLSDPLVFGVKELQKVNQYPLQCSCNLLSPNPSTTLWFDAYSRNLTGAGLFR